MKWISVEEQLPDPKKGILIFGRLAGDKERHVYHGLYEAADSGDYHSRFITPCDSDPADPEELADVTHWAPLPGGPEEYGVQEAAA